MKKLFLIFALALFAIAADAQGVKHITKAEFLEYVWNYEENPNEWNYKGDVPCIVDFYATWCGPCKRLSPILEELQKEYAGKLVIYKVNTEVERELAGVFGVQSIPTMLWCPKSGQPTITKGLMPKENLVQVITEFLMVK